MKRPADHGMTLLEVVIALSILLMGVGFILQTDAVSHRYLNKAEVRQQMLFYAAGILEATIEGESPTAFPPFDSFQADVTTTSQANPYLERVEVKVYRKNSPTNPEPVRLYTYRVKK
ncbi:MAG: prepilin-type N-terminal cleavage/methylation domain-containing protein [Desulfitobacterium hafniense]|nr:prepilin-type N-terminal cleavage/methylation domain-containing protein [Desulfitobacterium hafniense]